MSIRHLLTTTALCSGLLATPASAQLHVAELDLLPSFALSESAQTTAEEAPACADQHLSQEFSSFNDRSYYTLVPGGRFEQDDAKGITLAGGAALVGQQNPHRAGATSARIPSGGSLVTRAVCVAKGYPYARFFARSVTPAPGTTLNVDVLYADGSSKTLGSLSNTPSWGATRRISLAQGQFGDGETAIRFRFTVSGGATWDVDDVYVDPFMKR